MSILKNELTWSFSRSRLFQECRRAYFYHYYASWGGWVLDADDFTRRAYILKNIRNVDAWIGDIVHQIIKWVLENKIVGKDIKCEEAKDKAKQMLLRTWEQSRSKMWMKNIKNNLNLFEHYYHRELSREFLNLKLHKLVNSIKNVYESGLLASFSDLPREGFLRIDELDSFDFEGLKVFAIPDFAVCKHNRYCLYDWKTGKPSDNDVLQLSCYVLYAMDKWKVDSSLVTLAPVYLSGDKVSLNPVRTIDLEEVKSYIRKSISEMKSVLLDVEKNTADIQVCLKTRDTWRCNHCKFQEICQ